MPDQMHLWGKLEPLLFHVGEQRRWIQDSPILPNVWRAFTVRPGLPIDMLITPHLETRPAQLADSIRSAVDDPKHATKSTAKGKQAAAEGLLSPAPVEAPVGPVEAGHEIAFNQSTVVARLYFDELIEHVVPMSRWFQRNIAGSLKHLHKLSTNKTKTVKSELKGALHDINNDDQRPETLLPLVAWWLRLTGTFSLLLENPSENRKPSPAAVWERALRLLPSRTAKSAVANGATNAGTPLVFRVALNRRTSTASQEAFQVVKGDAASKVFGIDTSRICWAVIDAGIDVRHKAFFDADGKTRVTESYDFTRVRRLVSLASTPGNAAEATLQQEFGITAAAARGIRTALLKGGDIDWESLRPALRVDRSDESYFDQLNPHGTHVAGILGGRPESLPDREEVFCGMCPDIRLIDIRILDKQGRSKDDDRIGEFDAIAALQFVGHLNSFGHKPIVHGVNLSIQLQHDPTNFACGRTPVCEECNRLAANGVVVVAAAGNLGIDGNAAAFSNTTEGSFRSISIADPGNAEGVITVGSTHRREPHTFGISFFSSRGPTGDGRTKPDLVAPGEKILGPVGSEGYEEMQGTSQAAPYVSGAAAMLLARHSELIGDPAKVKAILCRTATDLGRLRDFQGAGLLDVLRALQSV